MNDVWKQLYQVVQDRKASPQEGSYTCYLFDKGLDKILKKVGEEWCRDHHRRQEWAAGGDGGEISDLIYHLTVRWPSRTSLWKLCWRSWTAAVTRSGI